MPNFVLRLTDKQMDLLKEKSNSTNLSIQQYVLKELFDTKQQSEKPEFSDVVERALRLDEGQEFSIPNLYKLEEWKSFSSTRKRVVGKKFYKAISEELNSSFKFLGKSSTNTAIYKRI